MNDSYLGNSDVHGDLKTGAESGLLERVTDGIVVLDQKGHCRFMSGSAAAMLGRPLAQMLGNEIWDELSDAVGVELRQACEEAANGCQPARLLKRSEGAEGWFEVQVFASDGDTVIVFRDVTADQVMRQELLEYAERMSEAERIVRFGVWEWEIANDRVRWSDELHRIYGLRPGDFGGTVEAFMEHLHPEDRERVWANIARSIETREPFVFEERITRADGEERILLSQGRVVTAVDGSVSALVGVCHDVTDRKHIEWAFGDNERRMRAILDNTPSMISVKDLSGRFLMCNAEYGHILGMEIDEIVGQLCSDLFPPEVSETQRVYDRRAASEGEPVYAEQALVRNGEVRHYLTSTFVLPDEGGLPAETCTIATDVTERRERESTRRERIEWSERIGSALDEGRMLVFAQPIIDLHTGAHVFSELLVRMRVADDCTDLLLPDQFLPAAERFGLIQAIDIWMVRQATSLPDHMMPEVNLSALTLCDPAARREIVELLKAAPEVASKLVFEITETSDASHLEAAREFARDIERLGGRLALDDFGTGFGSLTYLRMLPLSYLKIDLSFVQGMVESLDDRRVTQSILGIAKQFDLATIAEGVEDEATVALLRDMGADYAQGLHLGVPTPVAIPSR
jgi:PAS domain S-box-containing protein